MDVVAFVNLWVKDKPFHKIYLFNFPFPYTCIIFGTAE